MPGRTLVVDQVANDNARALGLDGHNVVVGDRDRVDTRGLLGVSRRRGEGVLVRRKRMRRMHKHVIEKAAHAVVEQRLNVLAGAQTERLALHVG